MYKRFVKALQREGIDAEYDRRQSIVTMPNYTGFFRDLYESRGELSITYISSDTEVPREPSPTGSGMFSGDTVGELASEAASHVRRVSEQLDPIRSLVREVVRENLEFRTGRVKSPDFSANGYLQKFVRDILNYFAKELKGAYDIEFEDTVETKLSVQTDYQFYNDRQDVFYEGRILIYEVSGEINIEARGGMLGERGDTFLETTIGYSDDPSQEVDIVSAFRTLM